MEHKQLLKDFALLLANDPLSLSIRKSCVRWRWSVERCGCCIMWRCVYSSITL